MRPRNAGGRSALAACLALGLTSWGCPPSPPALTCAVDSECPNGLRCDPAGFCFHPSADASSLHADAGNVDASTAYLDAAGADSAGGDTGGLDRAATDRVGTDTAPPRDASVADSAAADRAIADTSRPDSTTRPDAGDPDLTRPDTSTPDLASPDLGARDSSSDSGQPDASAPDAATDDAAGNWMGYPCRVQITLHNDGDAAGTLEGFPIAVRLNSSNFEFARVSDSSQLRFGDSDGVGGTPLPYEVELWEPPAALVWVRVPEIPVGTESSLWLYFGEGGSAQPVDPTEVWQGYGAVWHLSDTADSAAGQNTLINKSAIPCAGPFSLGKCVRDGAHLLTEAQTGLVYAADMTASAWVTLDEILPGQWDNPLVAGTYKQGQYVYTKYSVYVRSPGTIGSFWSSNNSAAEELFSEAPEPPIQSGVLYHVAVVRKHLDPEHTLEFYLNGESLGATVYTSDITVPREIVVSIGIDAPGAAVVGHLDGVIDEVRLTSALKSHAWIQAEYRNGTGELVSLGTPQCRGQ